MEQGGDCSTAFLLSNSDSSQLEAYRSARAGLRTGERSRGREGGILGGMEEGGREGGKEEVGRVCLVITPACLPGTEWRSGGTCAL